MAVFSTATLLILLAVGWTELYSSLAPKTASVVASLQRSTLNARDRSLQHKGYYENLDNVSRQSAQLWDVRADKPREWVPLGATPAYRDRNDFLGGELVPNTQLVFMSQPLTTNRWGMRDKERALAKPTGTYRIAILGPSHVMGSGVSDADTIPNLLEKRLNASTGSSGMRYEVLNFGVAGFSLTKQLALLDDRVFAFHPDAVFIVDSPRLAEPVVQHLANVSARRYEIPFPLLADVVARTGVTALAKDGVPVPFDSARLQLERAGISTRMPWVEAEQRLRHASDSLIRKTFEQIVQLSREHEAVPVFVALDNVGDPPAATLGAVEDAKRAGMLVFDLLDVWRGRDYSALRIADWDEHPNAEGNRIVAERLVELMQRYRDQMRSANSTR